MASGPHNIDVLAIATCVYEELSGQRSMSQEHIEQLAAKCPAVKAKAMLECR